MAPSQEVDQKSSQFSTVSGPTGWRILVVDDSLAHLMMTASILKKWGYTVFRACSAKEALFVYNSTRIDIILCDWLMPGMNGVELCRHLRQQSPKDYVYFVLITAKNQSADIVEGLAAGADDYLAKPVNQRELQARLVAGQRILQMQKKLSWQAEKIHRSLFELETIYASVQRDLVEASKFLESLTPDPIKTLDGGEVSLFIQSAGHVGGDLVCYFSFSRERLAMFSADVSGHGISSALMTARVIGILNNTNKQQTIAFVAGPDGKYEPRPPHQMAALLNQKIVEDLNTELYFTLAFADINLSTGEVKLVQAGHPHPLVLSQTKGVLPIGNGGLPIGLFQDVVYTDFHYQLKEGDKLLLYTDGITECRKDDGRPFDQRALKKFLSAYLHLPGTEILARLKEEIHSHTAAGFLQDDISAILFEYKPFKKPPLSAPNSTH